MAKISVVKRDGRLEDFQLKKIINGCVRAGAPKEVAEKIAGEIQQKAYDRIPASEIGRMVVDKLRARSPAAAKAFEKYTKAKHKKAR
ncbi:MAG: ATP cone domain-containing protein [Methanocellales archaeon]|nr:ATP cone domain-containing protein [Methanocellales archaeon]